MEHPFSEPPFHRIPQFMPPFMATSFTESPSWPLYGTPLHGTPVHNTTDFTSIGQYPIWKLQMIHSVFIHTICVMICLYLQICLKSSSPARTFPHLNIFSKDSIHLPLRFVFWEEKVVVEYIVREALNPECSVNSFLRVFFRRFCPKHDLKVSQRRLLKTIYRPFRCDYCCCRV